MPPSPRPVWTTSRKILGNLLPLLVASPILVMAILVFARNGPSVAAIGWGVAFLVAIWVSVALFALTTNGKMKRQMKERLHHDRPFDNSEKFFVGIASPLFKSVLDPHEDVGFLMLHADHLEFFGSDRHLVMNKKDIVALRFAPNVHTVLGLGRWISVDAVVRGIPARLLIEPREKMTLIGNLFFSGVLKERLESWKNDGPRTESPEAV